MGDVKNVKGSKARWTHLEPDARMKTHSPIKQELPDVWMLHVDNTHFDLIIKKDNRLATEGGLEQSNSSGKQIRTMDIKCTKQNNQEEEINPHKAMKIQKETGKDYSKEPHYTKDGRILQSIYEEKQRDDMVQATNTPKPELTLDNHKNEAGNSNTMCHPPTPISHKNK